MGIPQRQIQQLWTVRDVAHRFLDAASIFGALLFARWLIAKPLDASGMLAGAMAVIAFYLVSEITGMYRNWRGTLTEREIGCAVLTWAIAISIVAAAAFFSHLLPRLSRAVLLFWATAAPTFIATSRVLIRRVMHSLRARGINTRRFAVVGVNELGFQLAQNIERSPELGLRLSGFYDDRPEKRTLPVPAELGQRIGNIDELIGQARRGEVDMIYITFPMRAEERIRKILARLGDTTASVYLVPDFFVFELLHSRWTSISGLPVVSVFENPFYGIDGMVKRALDLCLAVAMLLIAAVPMAVIAVLVKLTSPGPVFFRQRRYGLDGREIFVWKFRTMRVCEDGGQVKQASRHDTRITPLGAVLRKTSLDELPQLFNVLEGTMSLVGPRPHANTHNEEYRSLIQGYMLRHKVKPGITGLAQVSGWRGETDTLEKMQKRIECDHRYIREWSLWMDIKILFRTIWVVIKGHNAY